jgi:hypothetical protein
MILCVPGLSIATASVLSDKAVKATNDAQSIAERSIAFSLWICARSVLPSCLRKNFNPPVCAVLF